MTSNILFCKQMSQSFNCFCCTKLDGISCMSDCIVENHGWWFMPNYYELLNSRCTLQKSSFFVLCNPVALIIKKSISGISKIDLQTKIGHLNKEQQFESCHSIFVKFGRVNKTLQVKASLRTKSYRNLTTLL
jgi:hypothetical protein